MPRFRDFNDAYASGDPAQHPESRRAGKGRASRLERAAISPEQAAQGPRLRGRVKALNADRGFGFITANGQDYFMHRTECGGMFEVLQPGVEVEFAAAATSKGPRAQQVIKI